MDINSFVNTQQQMEEVWRDARWIMDALQYARYKQPTGGISISWIVDFSKEVLPEKPPSTSSQPDFMPSPMPSPEPCHKHSGSNQHPQQLHVQPAAMTLK